MNGRTIAAAATTKSIRANGRNSGLPATTRYVRVMTIRKSRKSKTRSLVQYRLRYNLPSTPASESAKPSRTMMAM